MQVSTQRAWGLGPGVRMQAGPRRLTLWFPDHGHVQVPCPGRPLMPVHGKPNPTTSHDAAAHNGDSVLLYRLVSGRAYGRRHAQGLLGNVPSKPWHSSAENPTASVVGRGHRPECPGELPEHRALDKQRERSPCCTRATGRGCVGNGTAGHGRTRPALTEPSEHTSDEAVFPLLTCQATDSSQPLCYGPCLMKVTTKTQRGSVARPAPHSVS